MAIRRPKFKAQIGDPTTTLDGYICTLECGAMGLDVISGGRIDVWGGNLIPYCGRRPVDIVSRGTNLRNIDAAWAHWGRNLDIRTGYTWTNVISDLKAGYWIILQGDYDQFSLLTRCQDSFRGPHAVLLGPEFLTNGSVLQGDPLCKTWKYVPQTELKNFAWKLAKTEYGRYWRGQVFYARIKPAIVTSHYNAVVTKTTQLWNDNTRDWVYKLPVGTKLVVRPKQFSKDGVACYAVSSPKLYYGYYVPVSSVKLGGPV